MKKIFSTLMVIGFFSFGFSQSAYYNDYRRSITDINWQTIVADLLLTPQQKDQLFALNNRYPTYDNWVVVYKDHPDRWRADRYYEIERILGPEKYGKFKTKYYKGRNPIAIYNSNKHNYKKAQKEFDKHWKKEKGHHDKEHHGHGHGKGKH